MKDLNLKTKSALYIFKQIKTNYKYDSLIARKTHPFTQNQFWKMFIHSFYPRFGKPFLYNNDDVIKNIESIFQYFLECERFYNCENPRSDISAPSSKKGLLIIGNVGVGKSQISQVFESMVRSTLRIDLKLMRRRILLDRSYFYKHLRSGNLLFDELNSEWIANNYGSINIMKEILLRRSSMGKKTHLTFNLSQGSGNDINRNLLKLGNNCDQRMVDRAIEMFNNNEFTGKRLIR